MTIEIIKFSPSMNHSLMKKFNSLKKKVGNS